MLRKNGQAVGVSALEGFALIQDAARHAGLSTTTSCQSWQVVTMG